MPPCLACLMSLHISLWENKRKIVRATITLSPLLLALLTAQPGRSDAPGQEVLKTAVVAALDTLVTDLVEERPAEAWAYAQRLQAYLEAHLAFYGSAVALLGEDRTVAASLYVHRAADAYKTLDLATPSYNDEGVP